MTHFYCPKSMPCSAVSSVFPCFICRKPDERRVIFECCGVYTNLCFQCNQKHVDLKGHCLFCDAEVVFKACVEVVVTANTSETDDVLREEEICQWSMDECTIGESQNATR